MTLFEKEEQSESIGVIIFIAMLLMVFTYLMGGCAGPTIMVKDGAGSPELDQDKYACEVQWEQSAEGMTFRRDPVGNPYYGYARKGRIIDCLQQKGWKVQGS